MQNLTPEGQKLVETIAARYALSLDSAYHMLVSVHRGGGYMAQFNCAELGNGQWMRGGMTMVVDMFNHGLKSTVNNLCGELSHALANQTVFKPDAPGGVGGGGGGGNWWPGDLGAPSSSGAQNDIRYAFFPHARRLVVQREGQVTLFDTLDHRIAGVSQQQGAGSSLVFTSQHGTVSTLSLPLVSGPGLQSPVTETNFAAPPAPPPISTPAPPRPAARAPSNAPPATPAPAHGHGHNPSDLVSLLEKLGQLRDAGILTNDEYNAKKTEILSRL